MALPQSRGHVIIFSRKSVISRTKRKHPSNGMRTSQMPAHAAATGWEDMWYVSTVIRYRSRHSLQSMEIYRWRWTYPCQEDEESKPTSLSHKKGVSGHWVLKLIHLMRMWQHNILKHHTHMRPIIGFLAMVATNGVDLYGTIVVFACRQIGFWWLVLVWFCVSFFLQDFTRDRHKQRQEKMIGDHELVKILWGLAALRAASASVCYIIFLPELGISDTASVCYIIFLPELP
jgi:hypothetical protein